MFSVVIPLYNKAREIAGTLDSVLAQTWPPQEIIVVDDGSTDASADIVATYAKRGVQLIRQANQGESAARNSGVAAARGEFIAFLDGDDWWQTEHLSVLKHLITTFPAAAVFSTAHEIQREDRRYRPRSPFPEHWAGIVQSFFVVYAHGLSLLNSSTTCVRRGAIIAVGGFPVGVRRGGDIITWVKLALQYPVAHAETVTAVYNQQASNRTDKLREIEPPGSLQYLAQLINSSDTPTQHRSGLELLFDRIAFFTSAGFRLSGDDTAVGAIRRLAWKTDRKRLVCTLMLFPMIPQFVLHYTRKFRHKKSFTA